jgi:hypothetical protein
MATIGCVNATEVFATQSYAVGSKTLGPVALPDKFRYGQMLVDVSAITDLTTVINVTLEGSTDGGQSWASILGWGLDFTVAGYTVNGGVLVDGLGQPIRITGSSLRFPNPISTTRQIRGVCSFDNATHQPQTLGMTMVIW